MKNATWFVAIIGFAILGFGFFILVSSLFHKPVDRGSVHGVPATAQADSCPLRKRYQEQLPSRFVILEGIDTRTAYVKDPVRGFCYLVNGFRTDAYSDGLSYARVDCAPWQSSPAP